LKLLDATALAMLVDKSSRPPTDPATGAPVANAHARFTFLEQQINKSGGTLLIPTPALSEVLVGLAEAAPSVLERIDKSSRFKVADFDTRAAIELAIMTREALEAGDKKAGSAEPWQKVKLDRQIVAIARVYNVTEIYSDDSGVKAFADQIGMRVIRSWEMPIPPMAEPSLFGDALLPPLE
jgi:hypothetical protein